MKSFGSLVAVILSIFWLFTGNALAEPRGKDFKLWLEQFSVEARAAGIAQATLDAAFKGIEAPLTRVIELDRNQPELTQSLEEYITARVTGTRIANGLRMMKRYPTWLRRVERRHRIQRRFIVALWGIETSYGAHTGNLPIIHALTTLAHDGRRSSYFRGELLTALQLLDTGRLRLPQLKGSWAGAMGQCQFMPSSFQRYAVDADGDNQVDLWNSVPDILASAANYLQQAGWQNDQTWGRPVTLPENFDFSLLGLGTRLALSQWQALGVRRSNGNALPRRDLEASLIMPDGRKGTPYLVYDNFRALLTWNKSNAFAIGVGTLADRLAAGQ